MEDGNEGETVRILCSKLILFQKNEIGLQWLIGSPFYSPFTVVSTFKCIHNSPLLDSISPDYQKESEDLRTLFLKGFEIIGALIIGKFSFEQHAREAIDAARKMRNLLSQGKKVQSEPMIGAVADSDSSEVQFFLSRSENSTRLDSVTSFKDENDANTFIWETGCLLKCELPVKLPFYFPLHDPPETEKMFIRSTEAVVAKLQDPQVVYLVEPLGKSCDEGHQPVLVRGSQLDFQSNCSNFKLLTEDALDTCGHLCTRKAPPTTFSAEILSKSVFCLIAQKIQQLLLHQWQNFYQARSSMLCCQGSSFNRCNFNAYHPWTSGSANLNEEHHFAQSLKKTSPDTSISLLSSRLFAPNYGYL